MKKILVLGLGLVSVPMFASAVTTTVDTIIVQLLGFLSYVVPALITIAVIYFIWGVITFMTAADEEQKKPERFVQLNIQSSAAAVPALREMDATTRAKLADDIAFELRDEMAKYIDGDMFASPMAANIVVAS